MTRRKIVLLVGFIIILAFSAIVVYGENQKYSDYDYPDWVDTRTSYLFEENRDMTPEEMHDYFITNCRVGALHATYLNPQCVEVIVDAKLKPINERLDYLVWCETHRDGVYGNRCAETFEEWRGQINDW